MKCFVKIEDGVVVQKQPNEQEGFIEAPDNVCCGMLYDGEKFTAPERSPKDWDMIRSERGALLSACDWTQLADSPLSDELKLSYQEYRQELRDITESYGSADDVVWPSEPS